MYRVVSLEEEKIFSDDNMYNHQADYVRLKLFKDCPHVKNIRTPYNLCEEIVGHLPDLNNKLVLVLFNPEFYLAVMNNYPNSKIVFVTGSNINLKLKCVDKFIKVNPFDINSLEVLKNMKFDVVIGNPPYQSDNQRSPLWEKFIAKSFKLCKDNGYIALIHPSAWRKPKHVLFPLFKKNNLKYLEIHDQRDGQKIFNAGTRYDWYVLQKCFNQGQTTIVDEVGIKNKYNISLMECIPHKNIDNFMSIVAKEDEEKCEIVYSRSAYGSDKDNISFEENDKFKYPVVHATKSKGPRIIYSDTNKNGHFGVKKVIMGMASPENGFYDREGKYGMSQDVFGIKINNDEDGYELEKFIKTDNFKEISTMFKWAGFKTDHRAFLNLRYGFWKEFI